jgi:hypothetical protein
MPPCSTQHPQEEGALRSSSCLHAHCSRNRRVLRRLVPLLSSTPITVAKARVWAMRRGRGKSRTMVPTTTTATIAGAPRCGPPSTISRPAPSRCGQGCVLCSSSRCIHRNTPCLLQRHTMVLLAGPPSLPCRCLRRTSSRPRPLPGCPRWARGTNNH